MRHRFWIGSLASAALAGCGFQGKPSVPATPPPPSTAAAQSPTTKPAPFVVREASLPAGFPPPGPVGVVMIKKYPACREARVEAASGDSDSMFMSLFHHIESNKIPMTAPVEMTWKEVPDKPDQPPELVAMAFVYGQPALGQSGTQGKVQVIDLPEQLMVSVGVRGGYESKNLTGALAQLHAFIAAHQDKYRVTGPPRYLGYNSPFVPPFMRFGEVQLPISEAAKK
jgi:hypothetical protein